METGKVDTERAVLKVADVARLYAVEPSTVYRWVSTGKLPVHKTPGGQFRFKQSEVEQKPEVNQ